MNERDVIDKLLTTTRAVRKRLDFSRPLAPEIIEECLEIAMQAPTGGGHSWCHFIVVTDAEQKRELARLYKEAFYTLMPQDAIDALRESNPREADSWVYLAENLHRAPALVVPCVSGTQLHNSSLYGSVLPATWSFILALRARKIASCWTTIHIWYREQEVAELLGIPDDVTQAALIPIAYFTGKNFKPAKREPAANRTYWNTWKNRRET